MPKTKKTTPTAGKNDPENHFGLKPAVWLAILAVLVCVCFFPVIRYFFAQDDFTLIQQAATQWRSSIAGYFSGEPGQFRPLSKVVYFMITYPLFGLNAAPYHAVSLLFHIFNLILFYRLLMKLGVRSMPAVAATGLFGLSLTVLNVVAWISCIQQLLGLCFTLLFFLFGLEALDKKSKPAAAWSTAAYVLAMMSEEQAFAAPVVLWLLAYMRSPGGSRAGRARDAAARTFPQLAAFGILALFMLVWKGLPGGGPYAQAFGVNIFKNLASYLDGMFQLSLVYRFVTNEADTGLTVAHMFLLALVLYHLARGRTNAVVFALAYFLLTIAPTLPLTGHIFYNHLYIPALGFYLLLAFALEDLSTHLARWKPLLGRYFVPAVLVLAALVSFTKVRANETAYIRPDFELPGNFVLRRAMIAKNVYDDIRRKAAHWKPANGTLYMISLSDVNGWYSKNVQSALGGGTALKLFFNDPKLEVVFLNRGDAVPQTNPGESLILLFDDKGHLYTVEEAEQSRGRPTTQPGTPDG